MGAQTLWGSNDVENKTTGVQTEHILVYIKLVGDDSRRSACNSTMHALLRFLSFHLVLSLGPNGKFEITASVVKNFFIIVTISRLYSTWKCNHKWWRCCRQGHAVHGLSSNYGASRLWRVPHQQRLCADCCTLWLQVSSLHPLTFIQSLCHTTPPANMPQWSLRNLSVVLGTHNLKTVDESMRYNVRTCKHPNFIDVINGNDIMLLKVSRQFIMSG